MQIIRLSLSFILVLVLAMTFTSQAAPLKPRLVVLTDISTWETDDHESLIRLLVHADLFEIEALIISTGYSIKTLTKSPEKEFINIAHGVVDAYEKDLPNLLKRSKQVGHVQDDVWQNIGYWPSPKYLRERTMLGSLNRGKHFIGEENDSPGSDLIIQLADEADPRPLWVTIWGGGNTIAQSIYRVKKDRSADEFKTFLRKIRIYAITDQDRVYTGKEPLSYSSHGWMRKEAEPDLFFIWDECAWKAHNGTGKTNWQTYETHIQGHGQLGSQYPKYKYGVEGDTPAFLYLMPNGLNDPEDPGQCSWSGTYQGDNFNLWQAADSCRSYFDRFYPAAFNNFAARMDWAQDGTGNRNPMIVLDGDEGIQVLRKTPKPGSTVTLDASQTSDPDGDNLTFKWWIQSDVGTYPGKISITNSDTPVVKVTIPMDAAGKKFHVICEVTDEGIHNLSSYRRIIFEPSMKDSMAKNEAESLPALKDVFQEDFLFGGAFNHDLVSGSDPKAASIAVNHFNTATSENDMKWSRIQPRPGYYNWGPADDFMTFCEKHHMAPIGHTLVWKSQVPRWVFKDQAGNSMTREALLARMKEHINRVVGRYRGRIKGWDVVNEALNEDGTIRQDNWWRIISEGKESQKYDHIEYAFRYAHAADPEAELYYNDFNLDTTRAKCDGAIRIVKHLQSKGVRIDGVGIQLHAGLAGETYPEVENLEYAITNLAVLGVKVMVTELDIKTKRRGYRGADIHIMNRRATQDPDANTAETQKLLAEKYAEIFSVLLKHKDDISRVTLWGVYDATSWISGSPLLFDNNYQPKQAFYAVLATKTSCNVQKQHKSRGR